MRSPTPPARLLAWFDREKRSLPWRGTRDPYRIWVSEVMLQQTTVQTATARFDAFLARFPDLSTLARAREESVLAAWSGLGYYARARNLHRAAREILRRHGGTLPRSAEALRALPGFGEYTAAAVASLAFGESLPAAEANVTRVLSRVHALAGVAGTPAHREAVRRRAAEWQREGRPADVTAALMDLGQLVCRPRRPRCPNCPLAAVCVAFRRGSPERFPNRPARPESSRVPVAAALALRGDRALLVRRSGRLLENLWQFPAAEGASPAAALRRLERELERLGVRRVAFARPIVTRHTMVHRQLTIRVYPAVASRVVAPSDETRGVRWITARRLRASAIPTLTRKIALASGFLPSANRRILQGDESRRMVDASGSRQRPAQRAARGSSAHPVQGRNDL